MTLAYEQRLSDRYDALSSRLRVAGDYIAKHPVEVATRSLRSVSEESGLAPATFSRLARALDYDGFEDLRDAMRRKIKRRINNFAERAEKLQAEHGEAAGSFFPAHLTACANNIQQMAQQIDQAKLRETVDRLYKSNEVLLLGALGSTGVVEYLSYMASFCVGNWRLGSRMGASLGAALGDLGKDDALVIVTKPPFSGRVIRAAEVAHKQGAYVAVITDTYACPALRTCSASFIVPTESPHFYSSYVATMALAECMVGMLVSRAGPEARARISRIEESNRRLEEVSDG